METTHFSVVHGHGNAVSLTYTLNGDFGAYLVPAGSGVVLNNSPPDFNNRVNLEVSTGPSCPRQERGPCPA